MIVMAYDEARAERLRALLTKDADFVNSHGVAGRPSRLALISTGNIGNDVLKRRLFEHLPVIEQALMERGFVALAAEGRISARRVVEHRLRRLPGVVVQDVASVVLAETPG